jgi:hypothetical protein
MDDIFEKRRLVLKAYPTETWKAKVKKMRDDQIVAVFFRLRRQGKI